MTNWDFNAQAIQLTRKLGRKSGSVPKVQNVYHRYRFIACVKDEVRSQYHFSNSTALIVKRKTLWHPRQAYRVSDELLTESNCRFTVIRCHELDDFPEILDRRVGYQDFEVHSEIIGFTSSMGRTRPDSTSFKPRLNASSNTVSSGVASIANNSAVSSALSRGFRRSMAVLISRTVLIPRKKFSCLSLPPQSCRQHASWYSLLRQTHYSNARWLDRVREMTKSECRMPKE